MTEKPASGHPGQGSIILAVRVPRRLAQLLRDKAKDEKIEMAEAYRQAFTKWVTS